MEDVEENLKIGNVDQHIMSKEVAQIAYISQCLADDLKAFLGHLDYVTMYAHSQQSSFFYQVSSQIPAPTISPEIEIASIAAMVMVIMKQARSLLAPNTLSFFSSPSIPKLPKRLENFLIFLSIMEIWKVRCLKVIIDLTNIRQSQ